MRPPSVNVVKGTRETRISGDNVSEYRKRVQRVRDDTDVAGDR